MLPKIAASYGFKSGPLQVVFVWNGTGTGFCPKTLGFLCRYHSPNAPYSSWSSTLLLNEAETGETWGSTNKSDAFFWHRWASQIEKNLHIKGWCEWRPTYFWRLSFICFNICLRKAAKCTLYVSQLMIFLDAIYFSLLHSTIPIGTQTHVILDRSMAVICFVIRPNFRVFSYSSFKYSVICSECVLANDRMISAKCTGFEGEGNGRDLI
jgi:hypothetical protein